MTVITDPGFYMFAIPAVLLYGMAKGMLGPALGTIAVPAMALVLNPLTIYLLPQNLDKVVLMGTMAVFFAVINYIKLIPYTLLGAFDATNILKSIVSYAAGSHRGKTGVYGFV
jgi:hypothetical protein